MKYLDIVRVVNDNYKESGVRKGMVGTIIDADIRWNSFYVCFQDQRTLDSEFMSKEENILRLNDDICIGVKINDLELVRSGNSSDFEIEKALPEKYKNCWCKVENGYIINLKGENKKLQSSEKKMFDLIKELNCFVPFNKVEKKSVSEVLQFLKSDANAFGRDNASGHVTAGAFICDCNGNILLNHHKKSGKWFQFGGHCDGESDCLSVAKREVMEEAGIKDFEMGVPSIYDVSVIKIPKNEKKSEPEHKHFDINFMFIAGGKDFTKSNESIEIKWVNINEAKSLVSPGDISTHRMIQKYEIWLKNKKAD